MFRLQLTGQSAIYVEAAEFKQGKREPGPTANREANVPVNRSMITNTI